MGRRGTRRTIERGIYKDPRGFEVVARAGAARQSKRYPLDTALDTLRAWRDATASDLRDEAQPTADTRTLAGAIARFRTVTKLAKDHAYQPSLNAWIAEHGDLERRKLTPAVASQTFERWKQIGYSAQSLYYRRLVLQKVWRTLDGPTVKTPVDGIVTTRRKSRRPIWVDNQTILAVLMNILRHEKAGWIRTPKTRVRFLVLVTTGQRPAQMKRAVRTDVDLERGIWWVREAKGGEPIPLYLNSEMADAWRAFIAANAWGAYDTRSFARTMRSCGWPAGVRVYNARHATGFALSASGADLGDIQLALGHRDPSTTRIYVGRIEQRMRSVSAALEGRFSEPRAGYRPTIVPKRRRRVARKRGTPSKR